MATKGPPPSTGALDPGEIYLVECDRDPTALLARHAGIREGHVYWDDTNRERLHRVQTVKQEGEVVSVETDRGSVYRFRPLTVELYDQKVRANVELSPEFKTTEELKAFYRTAVL